MHHRKVFAEGICRRCRMRVTIPADATEHWHRGHSCGPVDTHHPMGMSETPSGDDWMIRSDA